MNYKILASVMLAVFIGPTLAFAETGEVTISVPADGAMLDANNKTEVKYEAVAGPDGDHLHLNVDGKRVDVIHQLKGSAMVDALAPGKHQICLAVNTKGHVPTGIEKCINVTSK